MLHPGRISLTCGRAISGTVTWNATAATDNSEDNQYDGFGDNPLDAVMQLAADLYDRVLDLEANLSTWAGK